jgi:hypothetical protein
VGTFYLACSQCQEVKHEYKESNRKRTQRFECHGKLTIHIDIPAKKATAKLIHEILHDKPIDVTTPPEVKREIEQNLHLDPLQLRMHLRKMFDINMITGKQIHYWWSVLTQRFYKLDEDHVVSTCKFLERNCDAKCELCFKITTSQVSDQVAAS